MNVFGGSNTSTRNYHMALAAIFKQYEDGLLDMEEANKTIMIVCGEYHDFKVCMMDAYERNVIDTSIVSTEMAAAIASFKEHGPDKIRCIKAVRFAGRFDLKEAKKFVEDNCMEITGYPTWKEALDAERT